MVQSMGVNAVFGLLILSITVIKAEEYVILDEPDFNVWDSEDLNPHLEAVNIFTILCENYYLTINNEDIDCSRIQFTPKESLLEDSNHVIRKRQADSELEGSGNAENEEQEAPAENQPSEDQAPAENPAPDSVDLAPLANNNTNDVQDETQQESDKDAQTDLEIGVASANQEPEDGQDKEEKPAEEAPKETDKNASTTQPPKPEAPEQAGSENVEVVADIFKTASINTEEQPKEQESKDGDAQPEEHDVPRSETTVRPPSESTQAPVITVDAIGKEGVKTQKVLPSDLAEVESDKEVKESESVDDEQSANAVIIKEPKVAAPSNVEGSDTDKQLARLATNAKASDKSSDSEPITGESSKTVSKASAGKDTTILIVLFAVVVVIGGAAFAYNFIKKRKQRSSENSDGANGIRKSLQNLASNEKRTSGDVEQGTEMKPLMKSESPVLVKEFSDKKKDVEA